MDNPEVCLLLKIKLTLILLKPKVISLNATSLEPGQPAHLCSLLLADQLQVLILISLKLIMESSENGIWIIPFKKFSRLRATIALTEYCVSNRGYN